MPNIQHLTFEKQRLKTLQQHASPSLKPTPCTPATLNSCTPAVGHNLSRQWDRRDLLTGCQVSMVLASSNGGSYVDASRP